MTNQRTMYHTHQLERIYHQQAQKVACWWNADLDYFANGFAEIGYELVSWLHLPTILDYSVTQSEYARWITYSEVNDNAPNLENWIKMTRANFGRGKRLCGLFVSREQTN